MALEILPTEAKEGERVRVVERILGQGEFMLSDAETILCFDTLTRVYIFNINVNTLYICL